MKVNYYLVPPKDGKVIRSGPLPDGVFTESDGKNVITILQDNKPYICKFEDWEKYIKTGKRPDWVLYEGEPVASETYEPIWTVVSYTLGDPNEEIVRFCKSEELAKTVKQQFEKMTADNDNIHYFVEKELLLVSQDD